MTGGWRVSLGDWSHVLVFVVAMVILVLATVDIVRLVRPRGSRADVIALLALVWLVPASANGFLFPLGAIIWFAGIRRSFANADRRELTPKR